MLRLRLSFVVAPYIARSNAMLSKIGVLIGRATEGSQRHIAASAVVASRYVIIRVGALVNQVV